MCDRCIVRGWVVFFCCCDLCDFEDMKAVIATLGKEAKHSALDDSTLWLRLLSSQQGEKASKAAKLLTLARQRPVLQPALRDWLLFQNVMEVSYHNW